MDRAIEPLNKRLKRLRSARGLTVAEVAKYIGVATSTYREWEYGRSIRGEPYVKLAEIMGSTVFEILTGHKYAKSKAILEIEKIEFHMKNLRVELNKAL